MRGAPYLALMIVLAGGAAIIIADVFGLTDVSDGKAASLVSLLAVAVWVGSGFIGRYNASGSQALRHVAIWLSIATLATAFYVWKEPIKAFFGVT
jgi:hypothetical protein